MQEEEQNNCICRHCAAYARRRHLGVVIASRQPRFYVLTPDGEHIRNTSTDHVIPIGGGMGMGIVADALAQFRTTLDTFPPGCTSSLMRDHNDELEEIYRQ